MFDSETRSLALSDCDWYDHPVINRPFWAAFDCSGPRVGDTEFGVLCEAHYNAVDHGHKTHVATSGSPTRASLERGELNDDPNIPIDVRAARAWHRAMVNRGTARNDYAANLRSYVRFAVEEGNLDEARARLAALLAYADFPVQS